MLEIGNRALLDAIDRSQARIEFNPDGTVLFANQLFLDLMEYPLAEIRGQHHKLFVSPQERESPAYAAFWSALRAGQFQAREFMRRSKSGREIWIQASYNPVFNRAARSSR